MTLPVTTLSTMWLGWRLAPPLAPLPESVMDFAGLVGYARSVPVRHFAMVGAGSAAFAATTLRIVQYRGGA